MTDPRFDGNHLAPPRRERYEEARDGVFGSCGERTAAFERVAMLSELPPDYPDVPYALLDLGSGDYHPLRIGLTAVGRSPENDVVLGDTCISRRHCVILVHATGGCEVHDTASRNGTRVNGREVSRVWVLAGDVLQLCDRRFVVCARVSREEAVFGAHAAGGESATGLTGEFGGTSAWCAG